MSDHSSTLQLNLNEIAPGLKYHEGIWYAKTQTAISYPDSGNSECYVIEDNSFWFRHRNRCLLTLLKKFPPPGQLLDIGGGNGYQAQAFQHHGIAVTLLETGKEGIYHAKERGVQELICGTFEQERFLPATLPAVSLFDVVEHVEDDTHFVRQIATSLQVGGRLYITVPAYQWLWSDEDRRAGHWRRYTIKTMRHLLVPLGFQIEFASYIFSLLPLAIFFTRTLPSKLHRFTGKSAQQHKAKFDWLRFEIAMLGLGWEIPFGSSCAIVAKKI